MSGKKTFKPLSPITLDDDAKIDAFAKSAGIPALVTPRAAATEREVSLTHTFPEYVVKALRLRAAEGAGSVRYQLLKALQDSGAVEIDAADLVTDRRGRKPGKQ